MDLGFTTQDLHHGTCAGRQPSDYSYAPDWQDLASRLHAGWATRRELLGAAGSHAFRSGHFDAASAETLNGFNYASRRVNPTASGNRKPGEGIDIPVAGDSESGARG